MMFRGEVRENADKAQKQSGMRGGLVKCKLLPKGKEESIREGRRQLSPQNLLS